MKISYICIMRCVAKTIYVALMCLVTLAAGCGESRRASSYEELLPHLADGDLLFRKGTGVVGRVVTAFDGNGEFSHVGIIAQRDGEWYVVHAVPHEHDFKGDFDRVKCDPVEHFLGY